MYEPGDILLNKYRIDALAGQGAFAQVYRATHLSLNAPRALKVLRRDAPGLGSREYADYRARFQLEAQLGARLDHPHVIRVYDFEQDGDVLLLVMEYAAGGSLAERIAQARGTGGLLVDEAVRIVREAAAGLAALHALDVVHRDIKPSNLLFDAQGRVKVSDLGLAQVPGGPSQRSLAGSVALPHPGTPAYMSPEQQFTTGYLPPASDVYSLGIVLFEMLTGRAYKNLRPGTRLSKVRDDAPEWLDELLARMLAKEPDGRPWDGSDALVELEGGQRIEADKRIAAQSAELARQQDEERQQAEVKAQAEAERQRKVREAEATRQAEAERQRKAREAEAARFAEEERQPTGRERAAREANAFLHSPTADVEAGSLRPAWQRIGIELIKIPAGEFLYGDNKQKVTLPDYWIAKTPVTNAQYKVFVDAINHPTPLHWQGGQIPKGKDNHPVVGVSWDDAQKFCAWAGLRLPSEQEWEKAARGTDGRTYPWGDDAPTDRLCNFDENVRDTTPVGYYSPAGDSPYGLVDMAGNVREWCIDWYDSECTQRVLRGSSWLSYRREVRAAERNWHFPGQGFDIIGFRCARSD